MPGFVEMHKAVTVSRRFDKDRYNDNVRDAGVRGRIYFGDDLHVLGFDITSDAGTFGSSPLGKVRLTAATLDDRSVAATATHTDIFGVLTTRQYRAPDMTELLPMVRSDVEDFVGSLPLRPEEF